MHYQINRGGQMYGPYTLADLKRYVESGHILPTDLTKSEEMAQWIPVSELLNPAQAVPGAVTLPAPPAYVAPSLPQPGYASAPQLADPPNLHWGLVLLFDIITAKLFQMVWNLIFSAWMRRVQPKSLALFYYIAGYVLGLVYTAVYLPTFFQQLQHVLAGDMGIRPHLEHQGLMYVIGIAAWICKLMARFNMKSSLEEHFNTVEPIGLRMSGFMTFFFGGLYIQAKLNHINEIKRAIRFGQYGR